MLPPIAPAGQGPSVARRTHPPCLSRCRSFWQPPSPELPEHKKDGGVCWETTHPSVWQPGDSGSSALKQEEEEEEDEEGTAQSDAICCTPLRSHWLPSASPEPRERAAGSHLVPHLPQQLTPHLPTPPWPPFHPLLSATSSAPSWSRCTLSLWESLRLWPQPQLLSSSAPPRLFSATLKLRGASADWVREPFQLA